jgi:DNA-directed RNA polymerase subunit RPC12/RpoP
MSQNDSEKRFQGPGITPLGFPKTAARTAIYTFTCPRCGGEELVETASGYKVVTEIRAVSNANEIIFGKAAMGHADKDFACAQCGYSILVDSFEPQQDNLPEGNDAENVFSSEEALITWLIEFGHEIPILIFTCTECGGHGLAKIRTGHATFSSMQVIVEDVDDDQGRQAERVLRMSRQFSDGGYESYGCEECGYRILDKGGNFIVEDDQLIEWLREHQSSD